MARHTRGNEPGHLPSGTPLVRRPAPGHEGDPRHSSRDADETPTDPTPVVKPEDD